MPITSRPIFDCLSCDAFEQQGPDPRKGACRRNPPAAQITGLDKFGAPMIASFAPPAGKGVWCMQHPMAKAFPPGAFAPKVMGEVDRIQPGTLSSPPQIDPASGEFAMPQDENALLPSEPGSSWRNRQAPSRSDRDDETALLPGETKPEKAN